MARGEMAGFGRAGKWEGTNGACGDEPARSAARLEPKPKAQTCAAHLHGRRALWRDSQAARRRCARRL